MRSLLREEGRVTRLCMMLCTVLAVTLLCLPAVAQTTGTLLGTVSDASGAAVPKAKVTLLNESSGDTRETQTNEVGRFTFAAVRPGTYTVKVASDKFKGWQRNGFVMNSSDTRDLSDIKLEVGAATESITVEANNALVNVVSSGEQSSLLSTKDIEKLTLTTRNVAELFKVMPGVSVAAMGNNNSGPNLATSSPTGSPIGNGLSINGTPFRGGSQMLIDGASVTDVGCNCTGIAVANPEFTQEVKVQTSNFGVDQPNGPVVFATTSKSAGNKYHGSALFNVRNNVFNSLSWADARNHTPKRDGAWYYPAGTFGGPVPGTKGKLLAWSGFEYYWQKLPSATNLSGWVPTASMRAGNFSLSQADNAAMCANFTSNSSWSAATATNYCADLGGTVLPNGTTLAAGTTQFPSGFTPNSQMMALMNAYFPAPNANASAGYNWYKSFPVQQNGWMYRARGDYNISDSTKLYVSYQLGNSGQAGFFPAVIWWTPGNEVEYPGGGIANTAKSQVYSANLMHVFSPTLTNEMVFTYSRLNNPQTPVNPNAGYRSTIGWNYSTVYGGGSNSLWAPALNGSGGLAAMQQGDVWGSSANYILLKATPSFQDNVSKVYKNHTFKTGFFYTMVGNEQTGGGNLSGSLTFNSQDSASSSRNLNALNNQFYGSRNPVANMMMGVLSAYTETNNLTLNDQAARTLAFYFMDDWKFNKRLTINAGVRFDHQGRWYERTGSGTAVWLPGLYEQDVTAGRSFPGLRWHGIDPGIPNSGSKSQVLFASPRIGFAYDVFGNGKTVVRGGWGMYRWNDQTGDSSGAMNVAQSQDNYNLPSGKSLLITQLGPDLLAGAGSGVAVNRFTTGSNGNVTALDPNDRKVSVTKTYNLTISRQLPWRTLLEVSYIGNTTDNLQLGGQSNSNGVGGGGGGLINLNVIPLHGLWGRDPVTGAARPSNLELTNSAGTCPSNRLTASSADTTCWSYEHYFPFWKGYGSNQVNVMAHRGYSNYNGFQAVWAKTSGALTFNLNYAYGKALGILSQAINPFVLEANYGVLNIDRPHTINMSYAYDLGNHYKGNKIVQGAVNGWTISGVTTIQSGPNIQGSFNNPNLGLTLTQADGTTGISTRTFYGTNAGVILPVYTCNPASGRTSTSYINKSCITAPAIGQYGSLQGPHYLAGAGMFNQDMGLRKDFRIAEKQNVQFSITANNFLNHANRQINIGNRNLKQSASGTSWLENGTSNQYGQSLGKLGGARTIMMGLRYSF